MPSPLDRTTLNRGLSSPEMRAFLAGAAAKLLPEFSPLAGKYAMEEAYERLPADVKMLFRAAIGSLKFQTRLPDSQRDTAARRQRNVTQFLASRLEQLRRDAAAFEERGGRGGRI